MMLEYLVLLVGLFRTLLRSRTDLAAENLILRQQLTVLTRPTRRRPRLRSRDKLFWVATGALPRDGRQHLVLVRPATVVRWHRRAWKLFWRWRSRDRLGRPRLSAEVQGLNARIARENPRWGSEWIRGELLKLGIRGFRWVVLSAAEIGLPWKPAWVPKLGGGYAQRPHGASVQLLQIRQ